MYMDQADILLLLCMYVGTHTLRPPSSCATARRTPARKRQPDQGFDSRQGPWPGMAGWSNNPSLSRVGVPMA